ncbi:MAG: secretin N-terminal domain-containing protein [Opitutales bacterium]
MKRPIPAQLLFLCLLFGLATLLPAQEGDVTPLEPEVEEPEDVIGTLILSDESALQVLDLLEQLTGKIILRRQDISPAKINFNSRGEITKQEAVLALESLLTLNGIMLTDMGGRFMKAVPATDVNRHVPQMLSGTTLDMPPSQQIYAKLFKLDYLNAEQASGTLIQPLLSQNSSFVPFPKSNALLITDALINLQRIEEILAEADRPQGVRESVKFIKLDFIQAVEAQNQIEMLIQGPLKSYLEGNTSVSADERTNQLLLVTHPGNVELIMDVVDNIDVDAAPLTSSEVFQLRQAKAEEVVPIIENIIQGQQEGRDRDAEVPRDSSGRDAPPSSGEGQPERPESATPAPNIPGVEANASLQFSNFVGLSADERTNSIVAYGTQQDLDTLEELITKIDMPLPQVRIEAIITEVSLSDNQASGINSFGFEFDKDGNPDFSFGGSIEQDDDSGSLEPTIGGIFGSGFALTGNVDGVVNAVLRTAESDSDVRILSTPTIVVSHNEEGVVNVSESRPIITSSSSSLDNSASNVRSNVEFRDIGIQLTVTPLIGADGSVQMSIEQTVDNIAGNTDIDGNEQPIIGRREATSTITVNSGEVIILGGLQENRKNDSSAYFPVLGKLPIFENIFGGDSTDYTRTELIIFVRPTVLSKPGDVQKISREKLDAIEGGDEVDQYLETGTTGKIYMEGSKFEEKPEPEEEETPGRKRANPRLFRR